MLTASDICDRLSLTAEEFTDLQIDRCFPAPVEVGDQLRWRDVDFAAFRQWCLVRAACEAQGINPDVIPQPKYTTQSEADAERLKQEAVEVARQASSRDDKPHCLLRWKKLVEASLVLDKYEAETGDDVPRQHINRAKARAAKRCERLGIQLPDEATTLAEARERLAREQTEQTAKDNAQCF